MQILVTGAAGFLGSHLVDRLLDDGHEVVGLDSLRTGSLTNLAKARQHPRFHLEIADVRQPVVGTFDIIYNLACPASPVHYQRDAHGTFTTSVLGVLQLIESARNGRTLVVQASTSEVYGDPEVRPQSESYWGHVNPIGERSCYDEGKRAAETALVDAHRTWGIKVQIARIFNTYGPRMAFHDGRVVSNFIIQALRGEPITVYGDGAQTRSFCYVDDLIDGFIRLAAKAEFDGPVNLGNPEEFTMLELANQVVELTNTASRVSFAPLPSDDPKQRWPDITRAREVLGFEPKVKLRDGLKRTIEDFRVRLQSNSEGARR